MSQDIAPIAADPASAPATTPAPEAPASAPDAAAAPVAATTSAAPVAPVPAQPTTPEVDPVADTLAQLNRQMRETTKLKSGLEARERGLTDRLALAERAEKIQAAIAAKDYLGALMAANESINPDEAALLLLDQANAREPKTYTKEDIERIAADKIKAEREEAVKAAEAKQAADMERAKGLYGNACLDEFKAEPAKYPLVAALGVKGDDLIAWATEQTERTGTAPSPAATLAHFETIKEEALRKAGWSKAEIAAAKVEAQTATATPAKPVATAPVADTGGHAASSAQGPRESMADYDKRVKATLRAQRDQRRTA